MGYDVNRFVGGDVDEELMCPICSGVLEEPVQAPICEHAFCMGCIQEWLNHQSTCPVDRQIISMSQLKPVPRILRNLLARLTIRCTNADFGCPAQIKLDALNNHLAECNHNPKRPVQCDLGCSLIIPLDEVGNHNCVRELHNIIHSQGIAITELKEQAVDFQRQINELKREVSVVTDVMRGFRMSTIALPPIQRTNFSDCTDEVLQWLQSLPKARVTRWGGMISTPDAVLQAVIRRSLSDCGCPSYVLDDLMENAHERRWSQGLSTLETRQMNRRRYEQYIARRIPGKQAVIVMACENIHMGDVLVQEPGIVMIFAHGIE